MKRWKMTQWLFLWAIFLPPTVTPAQAIDNVRVAYPSMNSSVFALVIAQKEGYFKEEGITVEMLSIRGEIAIRTALAGEVDFSPTRAALWRRR
jgi:ABC-type nitrate/sulfonate/bicarbonate transport system substrate-binding protein